MQSAQPPAARAAPAPPQVLRIECLYCSEQRTLSYTPSGRVDARDCGRCEYAGWVLVGELDAPARRELTPAGLARRL